MFWMAQLKFAHFLQFKVLSIGGMGDKYRRPRRACPFKLLDHSGAACLIHIGKRLVEEYDIMTAQKR
jgi:hypothetical protein